MAITATKTFAKNEAGELVEITGLINEGGSTPSTTSPFLVNGEVKTPDADGIVHLPANTADTEATGYRPLIYRLSGTLHGSVEIGSAEVTPTDDTFVILDGVTIVNPTTDCAIAYRATGQSMIVTLANGKANHLVCEHHAEMEQQQGAALYSENNMTLQGAGYLSVTNHCGHGIKASELRINGRPHICAAAIHDAIHGNSKLTITGGIFFVTKANDAFGTGSDGFIHIMGGIFRCYGVAQNCFDSKQPGYWFCDKDVETNAATMESGMSDAMYSSAYFGQGIVLDDGVEVQRAENGDYVCTSTKVTVSGLVNGDILLQTQSTDVTLSNAFIHGALMYVQGSKKVQVNVAKDTVNFILSTDTPAAINSNNNVVVEVKGGATLVIEQSERGINGSEITLHDTAGTLIIRDCEEGGVWGTDIYIATAATAGAYADDVVKGAIVIYNCGSDGDIHARATSKGDKANVTVNADNLTGIILVGSIVAEAAAGTNHRGVNLGNAGNVFVSEITAIDKQGLVPRVNEPYAAIPYDALPI